MILSYAVYSLYTRNVLFFPCLSYHTFTLTKNIIIKRNAVIYAVSFSLLIVLLSHLAFIKSL